MIFKNIEKYKNNVALFLNHTNKILYKDILNISEQFQKQIKERSLTILISENCVGSICGYLALLKANNVIMLVDSNIQEKDLQDLIKRFKPRYLYCSIKNQKKITRNSYNLIHSFNNFNLLESIQKISYKINDNLMLLISTSGSMAEPKFVKLSFNNVLKNTESIISYLNLKSSDCFITTMPMSYSYALSIINTHFFCGASIVPNKFSLVDKNFWKLYSEAKPSNINGVPYFYEVLNKIGVERILKTNLKFITQAGGKIKNEIFKSVASTCLKNDVSFFLMYGQTEASPRISYHKVKKKDLETHNIPIGKPINGGKIFLKKDNGSLIQTAHTEGELIYKGKNIFGGYAKNFDDLKSFENILELETGDLAIKDKKNIFFITGRKSRFIKVYGYRLNLDYIEKKINDKKHLVACLGINEKLFIFTKKKNIDIKKYISLPKTAFEVIVIKEFPFNNNGKISYSHLNELANKKRIN